MILYAVLAGILVGTFTGLIPGIHVNLINALLLSYTASIALFLNPLLIPVFIIAMSVTHTFIDSIPSVFLGAPDASMALGVLPGHRYLLLGLGSLAVKLTLVGSLLAVVFSLIMFPAFYYLAKTYELWKDYIPFLLIAISLLLIYQDKKKKAAILTYVASGILGLVVLSFRSFHEPLFPLLSGMFGVSTLLYSLLSKDVLPEQKTPSLSINNKISLKASLSAVFAGGVTSLLPGIGSSTAAILAQSIAGKIGDKGFMILVGGANTANFILSLATWLSIDKARNGSIVTISKISTTNNILLFCVVALFAASIATIIAIILSKHIPKLFRKMNYQYLTVGVIMFIVTLVILLNGFTGIIILLASTFVGLLPAVLKCRRSHAMACLLVPVIFFLI